MIIDIPNNLDLKSSLEFCRKLSSLECDDSYIYDYKNMSTVEPFGMLLATSKIREFMAVYYESEHVDRNFRGGKCSYAAHMGFFKSINQNYGKEPGEATGSSNYIPLTNVNLMEIKKSNMKNKINIYEYIENISKELANVLSSKGELNHWLGYSISELLRNVYEHSKSEELWYAGQHWPSKDLVEVAILDEGIGIKESFMKNNKIKVCNDEEAIKLAVQPGISNTGIGKISKYEYDNEGFGLYMISNICKCTGSFVICSGNRCLEITPKDINVYETSFSGTAIRIRIKPSQARKLSEIVKVISANGSEKAKEYRKLGAISIGNVSAV